MKNNIKTKSYENNMKGLKFLFVLLFVFILSASAGFSSNDIILNWKLDEGNGVVALDSVNNNYGIINHADFDTGVKYSGYSSLKCDNSDDYVTTVNNLNLNTNNTFNFWIYRKDRAGYVSLFTLHSATQTYFSLEYNKDTTTFRVSYIDDTNTVQSQTFTNTLSKEVWTMLTFSVSHSENRIIIKKGGVTMYDNVMSNTFKDQVDNIYFKLCNNILNNIELDSNVDDVTLLNFIPNSTVSTLLLSNDITTLSGLLENETETENNETNESQVTNVTSLSQIDIIKTFTPKNDSNNTNPVTISYTTNFNANCDLYINNDYVKTFINKVSGTYADNFELGINTYSLYCYVVDDGVLKYEFLDSETFNVIVQENGTLSFFVTGTDYDVDDIDLYLVTPCIDYTASVGSFGQDVNQRMNEGETFYFQKIVSGQATFNLPSDTHDFCLINGFVQYNEDGYTTEYNINNVYGFIDLGKINVPSNVTSSYTISTDLIDVYDVADVKAYGTNWGSVIASLFLILIGFILLANGMGNGNGKIVIGAVLLILAGCGVAFSGLLGVLI